MHIVQFDAGGGSEMRHFRNQRAAAVRVHIGANAVGDAHFANPGKLLQALEKLPRVQAEPQLQEKTSGDGRDRKSTRLNSSHVAISYAVFCLKKKNETERLTITLQFLAAGV